LDKEEGKKKRAFARPSEPRSSKHMCQKRLGGGGGGIRRKALQKFSRGGAQGGGQNAEQNEAASPYVPKLRNQK